MLELKDYQSAQIDFNSKAEDMFYKTEDEDNRTYIKRFKQFIDSDAIISQFLKEILDSTNPISYEEFLAPKSPYNSFWLTVKAPVDENEHIATMYNLLKDICDNKKLFNSLYSLGTRIAPNSTTNVNELIKIFLVRTLEPLVNFVNVFLNKEILKMEQDKRERITVYQTIHGDNNGIANIGQGQMNINMTMLQKDKDDILSLIKKSIEDLQNEAIKQDVKEDIIDNLELAQEQVEKKVEKPRRVQRAIESISSFIEQADKGVIKSVSLIANLTLLVGKLQSIIG